MRVLAISSYGGLGGSELATADFIANRPDGVEVDVLLVTGGPMEELLDVPTRVAEGFDGRPGPRDVARFSRMLRPILREGRYDVVWAVASKAAMLAVPAARLARVPLVWHKVDFAWDRRLTKPLAGASTGVIGVSNTVVDALGPLRQRRFLGAVTPPGRLDRRVEPRFDPDRPTIGTVARVVPYKGIHHMVRAAAGLSAEFPALRLVIAGGTLPEYPDYEDELRVLADATGLGDRLELLGHVHDVASVYERLDVFLSATYLDDEGFGLEGLGLGILEASWAGVPVVVARAGGSVEAIDDGRTGTLVDDAEPGALAAATAPYLRDLELARRIGDAGREFARRKGVEPEVAGQRLFSLLQRAIR
jgi:glycosyltransferase involved in cell wall biosynthesis